MGRAGKLGDPGLTAGSTLACLCRPPTSQRGDHYRCRERTSSRLSPAPCSHSVSFPSVLRCQEQQVCAATTASRRRGGRQRRCGYVTERPGGSASCIPPPCQDGPSALTPEEKTAAVRGPVARPTKAPLRGPERASLGAGRASLRPPQPPERRVGAGNPYPNWRGSRLLH